MKTTLEFNLPEEHDDLFNAQNGTSYRRVIEDLDDWLRNKAKYENKSSLKISEVRKYLLDALQEMSLK